MGYLPKTNICCTRFSSVVSETINFCQWWSFDTCKHSLSRPIGFQLNENYTRLTLWYNQRFKSLTARPWRGSIATVMTKVVSLKLLMNRMHWDITYKSYGSWVCYSESLSFYSVSIEFMNYMMSLSLLI